MPFVSKYYELLEGNVRCVLPYFHEFRSYAKGRWLGRELFQVVTKEFGGGLPDDYWTQAILKGQVKINNTIVDKSYIFRNNDILTHLTHRHEPPVIGSIEYVGDCDDILAISKPASMPVHPTGSYRLNTVTQILALEPLIPNQPLLQLVHRLDRVTSGLLILAKSKQAAAKISQAIRDNKTTKVYLARVKGKFPGDLSKLRQLNGTEAQSLYAEVDIENDIDDDDVIIASTTATTTTVSKDKSKEKKNTNNENKKGKIKKKDRDIVNDNGDMNISDKNEDKDNNNIGSSLDSNRNTKKMKLDDGSTLTSVTNKNDAEDIDIGKDIDNDRSKEDTVKSTLSNEKSDHTSQQFDTSGGHIKEHYQYELLNITQVGQSSRVGYIYETNTTTTNSYEYLTLFCPLSIASYRDAVHSWNPNTGKQSISKFRNLGYNTEDDTSLIECTLITGRTHQLRLHLQLLGIPIANDPCYGGQLFFNETTRIWDAACALYKLKKDGVRPLSKVPQILKDTLDEYEKTNLDALEQRYIEMNQEIAKEKNNIYDRQNIILNDDGSEVQMDSLQEFQCKFCASGSSYKYERILHCDGIWLHALRYESDLFTYQTAPPYWANCDYFHL